MLIEQLKHALDLIHDPARLGRESPLAVSPYFLGDASTAPTSRHAGAVTCSALRAARPWRPCGTVRCPPTATRCSPPR
ncbi:MAG: hypothetical protein R2838_15875 [Caldilineaceae bacterium]